VLNFLARIADEAYKEEHMERYEELEWSIETLKEQFNIPIFEEEDEEKMFLNSFYAKMEYLQDKERNDPLRKAAAKMLYNIRNI